MSTRETSSQTGDRLWTFDRVPLTLNQLLRTHWAARGRDLESWKWHILGSAGKRDNQLLRAHWADGNRDKLAKHRRVRLEITVYRARLQDPDNAVGSVKPLVDALNHLGWLVDDTLEWLDLEVKEIVDRKNQRTEVNWEALK